MICRGRARGGDLKPRGFPNGGKDFGVVRRVHKLVSELFGVSAIQKSDSKVWFGSLGSRFGDGGLLQFLGRRGFPIGGAVPELQRRFAGSSGDCLRAFLDAGD